MISNLESACRASGLTLDQLEALTAVDLEREPRARDYRESDESILRHAVHVIAVAARRIGLSSQDLVGDESTSAPVAAADHARLAAVLAAGALTRREIARTLGWDDADIAAAIATAKPQLERVGLDIQATGDLLRIVPAPGAVSSADKRELAWRSLRRTGLTVPAAEVLLAMSEDIRTRYIEILEPDHRHAMQTLLDLGLLEVDGDRLLLTEDGSIALQDPSWRELCAVRRLQRAGRMD